mmetsp:Transcript_3760/g.10894  ORF Transcript_3760/g.10894 Transcript_3760/m.10894 type:complete len:290 (-) Transcript_3760:292-1161(-)
MRRRLDEGLDAGYALDALHAQGLEAVVHYLRVGPRGAEAEVGHGLVLQGDRGERAEAMQEVALLACILGVKHLHRIHDRLELARELLDLRGQLVRQRQSHHRHRPILLHVHDALNHLARGHAVCVAAHGKEDNAPKGVAMHAPVRVDPEGAKVRRGARDVPIVVEEPFHEAELVVVPRGRELSGAIPSDHEVHGAHHGSRHSAEPVGRQAAYHHAVRCKGRHDVLLRCWAVEGVRLHLRVSLPPHMARAAEVSREKASTKRRRVHMEEVAEGRYVRMVLLVWHLTPGEL